MRLCALHDQAGCPMKRVNRVNGNGPKPCHIMLIGEAPGQNEDRRGIPFCGKSGSELDNLYLYTCARLDRQSVYVTNLVKCRTNEKDRDPNTEEIAICSLLLQDELIEVNPTYIGLVGRLSTQWMLGPDSKMEKMHGFGYRIPMPNQSDHYITVMPLYHPAFGLHDTPMIRHIMWDFKRFGELVRGDQSVIWRAGIGLLQRD